MNVISVASCKVAEEREKSSKTQKRSDNIEKNARLKVRDHFKLNQTERKPGTVWLLANYNGAL